MRNKKSAFLLHYTQHALVILKCMSAGDFNALEFVKKTENKSGRVSLREGVNCFRAGPINGDMADSA